MSTTTISPEILDRRPPAVEEHERAVLASVLLKPDVLDDVTLLIRARDFYSAPNGTIYQYMIAIHEAGEQVDLTLLIGRLKTASELENIGGLPYLAEIAESTATAANAEHYARIVKDKSARRDLILKGGEILQLAHDDSLNTSELLNLAESKIMSVRDQSDGQQAVSLNELLMESTEELDQRRIAATQGQLVDGVSTGYVNIDAVIGGFRNNRVVILAGRTGMGKTALALNIASRVAAAGGPTLFVSLEMSRGELCERLLANESQVAYTKIQNGTWNCLDANVMTEASNHMAQWTLFVDDAASRSVPEIAAMARRMKRSTGLAFIVIDYIQLMRPETMRGVSRQEQVSEISRRLCWLAKNVECPVLALAQLSRASEDSKDKRPSLRHLRESGALEQNAHAVLFIHRSGYYHDDNKDGSAAQIIIAKNRSGPTKTAKLLWFPSRQRFEDAAPGHLESEAPANGEEF